MPLENRLRKDTTDQSQASSSHSANPERLQQLRRAHGAQPEQGSKGKGMMTAEMETQDIQEKQQKWDNDNKNAIQEVIKQRDGKTSPQSEIRLGYNKERYPMDGGARAITENNLWTTRQYVATQLGNTPDFSKAVGSLIKLVGRGNINGVRGILEVWKQGNDDEWTDQSTIDQKKKFAEIMLN
jgi:hypothetical protein